MPVLVDHEKTRRAIAELALRIIADEGIAGLTTRRIGEVAGTSRALVNTYFKDMRHLTLTAFGLVVERQVALLEEAEAGPGGLRACVEALLPIDEERLLYWKVVVAFYGLALSDHELAEFQKQRIDGACLRFERILLREKGLTRVSATVREEAQRIVDATIGVSIDRIFHPETPMSPRTRKRMVDRVLRESG